MKVKLVSAWALSVSFLVFLIILSGCGKDELTEPASVTCVFEATSATAMDDKLTIDRLDLNLAEIDISGRRTSEGDMFFTRKFNTDNGRFELFSDEVQSTLFQVPQGSYQSLVFYPTLREDEYEFEYGNNDGEEDETGDLEVYVARARPGLLIVGRYRDGVDDFPVIVSLNDDIRRFAVEAIQGGSTSVVLQKEIPARAVFSFDPQFLFTPVTGEMLRNAATFPLGSAQAVVISEDYNVQMYNLLASRIQGAVALTFEE